MNGITITYRYEDGIVKSRIRRRSAPGCDEEGGQKKGSANDGDSTS